MWQASLVRSNASKDVAGDQEALRLVIVQGGAWVDQPQARAAGSWERHRRRVAGQCLTSRLCDHRIAFYAT